MYRVGGVDGLCGCLWMWLCGFGCLWMGCVDLEVCGWVLWMWLCGCGNKTFCAIFSTSIFNLPLSRFKYKMLSNYVP